ncbi:MAG: alpha/beta hydrolase [Caulobacterales bacterium]|nr:alpha/beta hydrolase [Caulobacterales bacterium]
MVKKVLVGILLIVIVATVCLGLSVWSAMRGVSPAELEAKYMTPADRFVVAAGARVRVREEGPEGAPVILLMHGFLYSLESWDAWAADLSRDYRVIRFDMLGHGLTGPDPQQRYSPEERAAFLGDLMDALSVDHAIIGGNSLGGLAAWRFAAAHPERADALILVSPGAYSINGVTETPVPPPEPLKVFLRTAPEAGVAATLARVVADPSVITPERAALVRDMMRRKGNGEAFIQSIEEFTLPDPAALLATVTAPALLLWGREDKVIPVEQGEAMENSMPNARLIIYDGVGHTAQEESPAATLDDVREFLNALKETQL